MLGNFLCFCCRLRTFFSKLAFSKKSFRDTIRVSRSGLAKHWAWSGKLVVRVPLIADQHFKVQWLSGRVLDSRLRGSEFEPHWFHCVVSLSKTHLSLLRTGSTQEDPFRNNWKIVDWDVSLSKTHLSLLRTQVQPRKTRHEITERLLTGMLRI